MKIKLCGMTNRADAEDAASLGVDLIGVIFYEGSKRFVSLREARPWLSDLSGRVERVGLFVNATVAEIENLWHEGVLDRVQLHGDETPEFCAEIARLEIPFLRALRVKSAEQLAGLDDWSTDTVLLDAFHAGGYGGMGTAFDWSLARQAVQEFPHLNIFLAGGLTPGNVAQAIRQVQPAGVDVVSGVEATPGRKDPAKVRAFVAAVREAEEV